MRRDVESSLLDERRLFILGHYRWHANVFKIFRHRTHGTRPLLEIVHHVLRHPRFSRHFLVRHAVLDLLFEGDVLLLLRGAVFGGLFHHVGVFDELPLLLFELVGRARDVSGLRWVGRLTLKSIELGIRTHFNTLAHVVRVALSSHCSPLTLVWNSWELALQKVILAFSEITVNVGEAVHVVV